MPVSRAVMTTRLHLEPLVLALETVHRRSSCVCALGIYYSSVERDEGAPASYVTTLFMSLTALTNVLVFLSCFLFHLF